MHRKVCALVVLFFATVFSCFAESSEWYWEKPIARIEFNGLKNVKKSDLQGITSSFVGQPFSADVYNELLDRLYSLDFFDDITPFAKNDTKDENKVLLVFEVVERPIIASVNFIGNRKIRNSDLRPQVKTKPNDIYIESKILLDERVIRNYYLEKGYTASYITHSIEETPDGVVVNFQIQEGNSSIIREINFVGNTIVSSRTLRNKLTLKEIGFMKDGAYQPSTLEQDKQNIINYYLEKGYADVSVLDVKVDSTPNEEKQRDELTITFIIQEGAQYTYAGMDIKGNEVFTTEELLKQQKLKKGAIFNATKFQEDYQAIQKIYADFGYMTNEYYPVPTKNSDRHEISYEITIREHSRSHVENIIIKGNTKTKEYVIKREIPIEAGDTITTDKIYNGLRNLMNLRYFSNVVPNVQQGAEENLVDLIFAVEEQSTNQVMASIQISGQDTGFLPGAVSFRWENSNLFGEGRTISTGVQISNSVQTVDVSYSQGWIGNLPITFNTSLAYSHSIEKAYKNDFGPNMNFYQNRFTMKYDNHNATLSAGLGRRWFPDYAVITLSGGVSTSLQTNIYDESNNVPVDTGVSLYANRLGISDSIYGSISIDNRDYMYDPSKGWFFKERLSWHGLLPGLEKEFFLKSDTTLEGYLKLIDLPVSEKWSFKTVLAGYTGITAIIPRTEISEGNNVYIDGMINGRGWNDGSTSRDTKGMFMLSNRLELRIPIIPNILGIDGFWDAAAVLPKASDFSNLKIEDFYFSFGPAVRFLIPQLPLHLMWAWRYRIEDGQPKFAEKPMSFVLSFNIVNY
ncbi:MAG: outer membrane protein assembly factor BamA [Treponema sp.]|nr:outer membrane protein assembly factor BamA [Treponema sp.]